jgi:hypothetical protein
MVRSREPRLRLTRAQAATRQIEAAIAALEAGHYDLAITLAGAAEGMFKRRGRYLFRFLTKHEKLAAFERRTLIDHLNRELVWLKHEKRPNVLNIRRSVAASMITRAASKLKNWTPGIERFRAWLIENVDDVYR